MTTSRDIYVVGMTGGVGSGKSTAASLFAKEGVFVLDVDDVSRALTATGGAAVPTIENAFPQVVRNGEIDRSALRELVFANPNARKTLESILHPLIRARTQELLASDAARAALYVLLVVPLLFESNAYALLIECAIVVDVPVATQIARVTANRGVARTVAEGIVAAQMPRAERLARAQFVLDNDRDLASLVDQVERLHRVLLASARCVVTVNESMPEAVV
jgi:dephospho-CoA kinase